ncbi:hypothetical protein PYK79_35920 [Streptomyces sp. ID05-04B]|nr:hypothetical protein [Streptomyces sp. ID05-04B]
MSGAAAGPPPGGPSCPPGHVPLEAAFLERAADSVEYLEGETE